MTPSRLGTPEARRRTNQALMILVVLAAATGLFSNTIGVDWWLDPATIHGGIALAIALLTPWKTPIVQRGLGRHRRSRWASLVLLSLIAVTLISGLLHSTGLARKVGLLTVMQIHIGGALIAIVLIIAHYRAHPVPVRKADLNRRAFVSAAALSTAAAVMWFGWEGVLKVAGSTGADRRFTGSHERGSYDPVAMPVTSWWDDHVQQIDGPTWAVRIDGRDFSLSDLDAMSGDDVAAILDCTSGWYSEQMWSGVRLDRLLNTEKNSIEVRSATGYTRRFPVRDLDRLWLVTAAGGQPLSAGHGFPARIVAPGRRGFWWVKWVSEIRTSDTPWWVQPPFPVT